MLDYVKYILYYFSYPSKQSLKELSRNHHTICCGADYLHSFLSDYTEPQQHEVKILLTVFVCLGAKSVEFCALRHVCVHACVLASFVTCMCVQWGYPITFRSSSFCIIVNLFCHWIKSAIYDYRQQPLCSYKFWIWILNTSTC